MSGEAGQGTRDLAAPGTARGASADRNELANSYARLAHRILLAVDDFREEHNQAGGTQHERRPFTLALMEIASLAVGEAELRRRSRSNVVQFRDYQPAVCRRA